MIRIGSGEAPADPDRPTRVRLPGDPTLVRADDWWNDKIPHLIAIAAIGLTGPGWTVAEGVLTLVLFLVSAIGVAAFGHVVNDAADIAADRAAGKPNRMASLSRPARALLLAGCLVTGLLPWIALPRSVAALSLLAAEVALLVAYSVPPVRLKNRAAAGALADALYAYSLPMALAVVVFGPDGHPNWALLVAVGVLGLLVGLRGIVWHQVLDLDNDRAAGIRTLVTRFGARRSLAAVDVLAPVELAVLGALTVVASIVADAPAVAVSSALYVPWRLFQLRFLWSSPLGRGGLRTRGARSKLLGYGLSTGLMERWLPVVALLVLSWREPWWWLVTVAYLLSFSSAVSELVADVPRLMDGSARLSAERAVRRTARQIRSDRAAAAPVGVSPVPDGEATSGRWVFVLCGSAEHTGALRTAVRHLGPLTGREIWVLTDRSRNEEPLDESGVARVVDVAAPAHLDDHQAAIWLKTSVHRHLPAGEWCYLDTDIIAIAAGVDELFGHRAGPVAFASDRPLTLTCVDDFSPFAMTCGCLERGVLRCDHLRRQLSVRLEVEVPADWGHWNGGVFVFGPEGHELLDLWHRLAVESFDWPEWRTRDQGALIATAWLLELQDLPRLPAEFNFIVADPWSNEVHLDRDRGWSLGPDGPWVSPKMLHLFQSGLDEAGWDLSRDVEVPIIRRTLHAERVAAFADWRSQRYWDLRIRVGNASRRAYWGVRKGVEFLWARVRRTFRRLRPRRIIAAVRRRTGRGPGSNRLTNR